MKAIVGGKYGPPELLSVEDVDRPVPKDGEVLIEVQAAGINKADYILIAENRSSCACWGRSPQAQEQDPGGGRFRSHRRSSARASPSFKAGDEVFGNLSKSGRGAYAEYVCAREEDLVLKPANVTFVEAASVPIAGLTALQALRDKGKVRPGHKVLINGASGGVGTFAVQIAKSFGAEVTAVCSTANLDRCIGSARTM